MALERETELWLKTIAETSVAHMKYVESLQPEERSTDDQGLYKLEQGFMTLYSLYVKGDIPRNPEKMN